MIKVALILVQIETFTEPYPPTTNVKSPKLLLALKPPPAKREFFIDSLLVRIHFIILVDRSCAMGV